MPITVPTQIAIESNESSESSESRKSRELETIPLDELAKPNEYTRFSLELLEKNIGAINTNLRGLNKRIARHKSQIQELNDEINQKHSDYETKKKNQELIQIDYTSLGKNLVKISAEIEAMDAEATELSNDKHILEKSLREKGILKFLPNRLRGSKSTAENDPLPNATKQDIQDRIAGNKASHTHLLELIKQKKAIQAEISVDSVKEEDTLRKLQQACRALGEDITELDARQTRLKGKLKAEEEKHAEYTLCLTKITIFTWLHKIDQAILTISENLAALTKTTQNDALHDAKVKKGLDALAGYLSSDTKGTEDAEHATVLYPIRKIYALQRMIVTVQAAVETKNLEQLCKHALAAIEELAIDDDFYQECKQLVSQAPEKLKVSSDIVASLTTQINNESLHILTTVKETIANGADLLADEQKTLQLEMQKAATKKADLIKKLAQNNSALTPELNAKQTKKADALKEKLAELRDKSTIFINKTNKLMQEGYLFNNAQNKSYGLSHLCTSAFSVNNWAKNEIHALNSSSLTIDKNEIVKCKDALQKEEVRLKAILDPRIDMQKRYLELLEKYMAYRRKNFRRYDRFFIKKAHERKNCVNDLKLALNVYANGDEHADTTPIRQVINANKSKFKFGFFALHFTKKQPAEQSLYYLLKSLEEEVVPVPRKAP